MYVRISIFLIAVASVAFLPGCSERPAAVAPEETTPPASRGAKTLEIPGRQLPADHPPVGGSGLTWTTPAGWTEQQPSSSLRLAQYGVPGDAGPSSEGQCAVFYFGPGQGGDPMANAARWAGQFTQPGGGSSIEAMKVTEIDSPPLPTRVVEVTGTYDGGMTMTAAPPELKPGYMLLGAIVEGPDAPWFFKLTGPEATVRAQRAAFVGMLDSIAGGG